MPAAESTVSLLRSEYTCSLDADYDGDGVRMYPSDFLERCEVYCSRGPYHR